MKKYELTTNTKIHLGRTLYQIKALISFGSISEGDFGGWIEKEANLSQDGNAWVYGNAEVYGNAKVSGNAEVYGNAKVYGNAEVSGNAWVSGNAKVSGNAWVSGNAKVSGNAEVYGIQKQLYTDIWHVTFTNDYIKIGCQTHSLEEWKNFSEEEISDMDSEALEWWKRWKDVVIKIGEMEGE